MRLTGYGHTGLGVIVGGDVISPAQVRDAIQQVVDRLAPQALGILVRDPPIDIWFPQTSDLDFVVLADIDDFRTERLPVAAFDGMRTMTDLTWIPWAAVKDPEVAATHGWVPHRLLSSKVVSESGSDITKYCQKIAENVYRTEIQQKRIAVFLDLGFQAVREVGITWDFPALALFWLHMAHSACLAAMLDGMRRLCPNVFTRPFDYVDDVAQETCPGLRRRWIEALHLDTDLAQLIRSLKRVYAIVAARFPEPDWPQHIHSSTRFEYRYWLAPEEVDWRIRVALEMARRGDCAASVFYLRFCAYALARIPIVHACSIEGQNVNFLRPEKAVRPALERLIPEIIDDLNFVLGGTRNLDGDAVGRSLFLLTNFRDDAIAQLQSCLVTIPAVNAWEPCRPLAA